MPESLEPIESEPPSPWQLSAELLVALCLGYMPNLFAAVFPMEQASAGFTADEIRWTVYNCQILAPLLYIMWRSDGGWAEFGIGKPDLLADTTLSIVLLGFTLIICTWLKNLVAPPLDPEALAEYPRPSGFLAHLVLFVSLTCNSLVEEFLMRAYLITRLRQLGAHVVTAVAVSAAMFASYHVYQGYWVLGPHTAFGLLYGATYVLTGRIWPLVVAHTAHNMLIYTLQ